MYNFYGAKKGVVYRVGANRSKREAKTAIHCLTNVSRIAATNERITQTMRVRKKNQTSQLSSVSLIFLFFFY